MNSDERSNCSPWHPLTFGGVAAFGEASFSRVIFVQFIFALLSAASLLCLFYRAWEPALRNTIDGLPDKGAIRRGNLEWSGPAPTRLSDSPFLSIIADPGDIGESGHVADLQLELRKTHLRVRSLLGYVSLPYPPNLEILMSRAEWEPWWGAWRPIISAALAGGVVVSLLIVWALLAILYAPLVRFIAFYADRHVTIAGSWRVASAALMPGALLMSAALIAYAFGQIILVQLLLAGLIHFAVGWIFVLFSPFQLPRLNATVSRGKNPFAQPRVRVEAEDN